MSTDEKPTNCAVNSLFLELDTGDFYYFNGIWKKVGENVQLGATDDTGTIQITENGTVDVYDYDYADVSVPGTIPIGVFPILENETYDVSSYASAEVDVDYVTVNFNLPALTRSIPTALSLGRENLSATTVGDYALFGGGWGYQSANSVGCSATVDSYNTSFTRTTPTALIQARYSLAATTAGNYALFGGGYAYSSPYYSPAVDAYDTDLTRTTPTALSQGRTSLAATTVGNYALFGGGYRNIGGSEYSSVVDAYDLTLTRTTPTALSRGRYHLAATTVGNYALFGGGYYLSSVVDAYDTSLTRTTPTALSEGRRELAATTVAPAGVSSPQRGYALFGGGFSLVVDAYDTSLTRTTPTELSKKSGRSAATAVAPAGSSSTQIGYALFGGGSDGSSGYISVVDAYDLTLTRTTPKALSRGRSSLSATTVGDYALFGGGTTGTYSHLNVVDAYSLASYDIQVFPGTKYSFNGSTEQISSAMQTISMQGTVVGYIKVKNTTVN